MTTVSDRTAAVERLPAVAALFVRPAQAQHMMTSVWALRAAGIHIVAGCPNGEELMAYRELGCEGVRAISPADLINQTWELYHLPVLAVADAVSLPDNFLGRALQLVADDLRVATVSFLSNDAGLLSFPVRNEPSPQPPEGNDATSVSRRLRDEYANGRVYYKLDGQLIRVPDDPAAQPNRELLAWHEAEVFRT